MARKPSGTEREAMKAKRIDHRKAPGPAATVTSSESETGMVLKTLAKHVAARLAERAFCVVFEDDVEHCWPRKKMTRPKRERKIQSFAESQGWTAAMVEGVFGMRVIFRTLEPGAVGDERSSVSLSAGFGVD